MSRYSDSLRLVKALRRAGWRVEKGRHWKAWPKDPLKAMVTISFTPSDRRSLDNSMADLRRAGFEDK